MSVFRSRSLFWTLAASFLLVLVTATLLQGLIIVAVVEPIASLWAGEVAEDLARDTAWALAALEDPTEPRVSEVLRSAGADRRRILVFRFADGRAVSDRPVPPFFGRHLEALLAGREVPEEPRRGGGWARPGPPGREHPRASETVLAREAVESAEGLAGEVIVLGRAGRLPLWPPNTPRPVLFFLPVAILLSAIGGLLLFRVLVRRLRALETLANRVTEGDLDARVRDAGGDEIGRLGQRLNRMTESLSEAKRKLDSNEAQRRRMLADVSHELATPLTSIRGYAETLLNPDVAATPEERARFLGDILDESSRMELLIDDLFDLTRLEAGATPLQTERLDWAALCRLTVERFQARAAEAGISLEWVGASAPAWIVADGRRQEQVVENLLVNALRYVPAGGSVTVSVRASTGPEFVLEVADDGPGVPEPDLEQVFDRFYRGDASRSDVGSGLGLAIVKEITQRHGGSVTAANNPSGGAVFRVVLPASPAD